MSNSALPGIGRRATSVGRFDLRGVFGVSIVLLSGCVLGNVHDLELDSVRVVEEPRVIPQRVHVFRRAALDLRTGRAQPLRALVDRGARRRVYGEVMQAYCVAVVRRPTRRLSLTQADRRGGTPQVVDRLAALALDLADAVIPERGKQVAVERQAALDRRDDEIDVVNAGGRHRRTAFNAPARPPARGRSAPRA